MTHIHNSQHNQNFLYTVQTNTAILYGHSELPREEKSKFELEEKKVQFITENGDFLKSVAWKLNFQ